MIANNNKCLICKTTHKTTVKYNSCLAKYISNSDVTRDSFDSIVSFKSKSCSLPISISARSIISKFANCLESEYVDFDRKGRGDALNHDLYGFDPLQNVAVIQARHAFRRSKNHFLSTHKSYFLCGFNEITEAPFRHPISSSAIRGAIRSGADSIGVVYAAQRWMWEVTEKQLIASTRQGDLLLVPVKGEPSGDSMGQVMTLAQSHEIHASEIRKNGRIYAFNPKLIHTKGQHAEVAVKGWATIRVAREEPAWDFAVRIGD